MKIALGRQEMQIILFSPGAALKVYILEVDLCRLNGTIVMVRYSSVCKGKVRFR